MARFNKRGYITILVAVSLFVLVSFGLTLLASYALDSQTRSATGGNLARDVYRAIVGDPARGYFGYVGDVGDYPADLKDLFVLPASAPAGWNGPYLTGPLLNGTEALDSYLSPFEYFLSTSGSTHQLAVISRGPDHYSTNTSSTPNVATSFTGTLPSSGTYFSGAGNADNLAIPDFSSSTTALNFGYIGNLALDLTYFEDSTNTSFPGCPLMYTVEVTSVARGTSDQIRIPWSPNLVLNLPQGAYRTRVMGYAFSTQATHYVDEAIVLPGATERRQIRVIPLHAVQTNQYGQTVHNRYGQTLFIRRANPNATNIGSVNNLATTNVGNARACAFNEARITSNAGPIVDTWVMSDQANTRTISNTTVTVTITNTGATYKQIGVLLHTPGVGIGNVYKLTSRTFTIPANATVTYTDPAGTAIGGSPVVISANTNVSF